MKKFTVITILFVVTVLLCANAEASLIFVPNSYGLSAKSIGMGNAMTAVGDDSSVAYFNPAALATLDSNNLDVGYLFAAPRFTGGVKGGDDFEYDTDNKIALVNFSMNLSTLFNNKHGLGLGMNIAVDDNLKSFLTFEESRDDKGQFLRYGISSVMMNVGLGVQIIKQLHIGGGGFIMIKGENTLIAQTDLAGATKQEEIQVRAKPAFAPTAAIFAPVHEMVTLGLTYKARGMAEFSQIDATADALVSESTLTELSLVMAFKDTYVPQQAAFGVSVRPIPELLLAVDATWANWADYDNEIKKKDVVWGESDLETKDIYIPRLGIEYAPIEELYLRFGYYFEDSPFEKPGMGNTVALDNAKHVGSIGIAWDVSYIPFMSHPLTLGASYFHHYLAPRTVESDTGVEYESSGNLNGVVGNLTLRF